MNVLGFFGISATPFFLMISLLIPPAWEMDESLEVK